MSRSISAYAEWLWMDSKFSADTSYADTRSSAFSCAGDVAHDVLHELRVLIRTLGDELLVGAFEDAIELAGGLGLGDADQLFDPDVLAQCRGDRDVRALVVGAVL